jgi:hypothetical protein
MFEAELRLIAIDLQGQTLDGRYRLDALLDVGSDRMLWRATDQNRQQTVAIQIWAKESTPAESDLNAALLRQPENVHPVFAPIEGCGKAPNGGSYAVYPAFVGRYLDGWLAENAIGMADLVELGAELASAVAALHKSGHVHGKLDTSVVLASDESGTVMRIVDAGLAGLAAVPRGSAVKGELTRVGELVEKLLRAAATAPDMTPEATHELEELVGRTREDAAEPLADMDQFAERLQALLASAPPRKTRGAQRKVTTTMDFANHGPRVGDVAVSAGPARGLGGLEGATLGLTELESFASAAQESGDVDFAQLADPLGDHKGEPGAAESTSESGELPELPPPPPLDGPGLPGVIGAAAVTGATETAATSGMFDAGMTSPPGVGPRTGSAVARPPTAQLPAWPETKRKSKVDPKAVVVAVLLVLMIGVFVFVLLPGPDRPATPLEALRVTPADVTEPVNVAVVNAGVDAGDGPAEVVEAAVDAGPSDTMAVLNIEEEPEPDAVAAAVEVSPDIAPEPDTAVAVAPDVVAEPDTAVAATPDVSVPDLAVAVVPDVAPAPDTAVAVAAPDVATQPETAPASAPDTDLPVRQVLKSKDDIRAALAATEEAIKTSRKDGKGTGVTKPLQQRLLATFKEGKDITVHPFGIYHLAMYMLDSGTPAGTIGAVILSTHESGGF